MLERLLNQKAMITTILVAVIFGGLFAYVNMGKLEDAEIPIKSAVVVTLYPGASAHEVELEVTDVLERGIQLLENIDDIESISIPGVSYITINIKETVKTPDLPQLWDHLRRKVNDVKGELPPGAMEPVVNDDFADVYGMFFAITSDGYSAKELNEYVDYVRRELLDINGVKRAQVYGKQIETIDIFLSTDKLASLSINPMMIAVALQNEGAMVNAGTITSGTESIRVGVGNKINDILDIENLLIQVPDGGNFRLGDIASVQRSVMEHQYENMTFNGSMAMSLGLSNEEGANVVELGERVRERISELRESLPVGIDIHDIYSQPDRVQVAVNDFMMNLIMSVGIVIIVLLFAMGLRSGLLIASGLVFTIFATLLVMLGIEMPLHRVTLAAIILAMGMLVDNSIVVADGILIDLKSGMNRGKAFVATAKRTALPLLGATLVAILAFLPLRMAPNAAGEFLSSLFVVLMVSLFLSWLFAMVQTPFMAKYFYRKERPKGENANPFEHGIYPSYRKLVSSILSHKYIFLVGSFIILVIALMNFGRVRSEFMPKMDYNQFFIEYHLPQGNEVEATEREINDIRDYISTIEDVKFVVTATGRPPARYSLMRPMATGGHNYGELIIETYDSDQINGVIEKINAYTAENHPQAIVRNRLFGAAFNDYDLEVQFLGPDPKVLRELTDQAKAIMQQSPNTITVTDNWLNQAKVLKPVYSVEEAQKLGISRNDMANSILVATDGLTIGALYEGIEILPIMLKTTEPVDNNVSELATIPVWGQYSTASTPLGQITNRMELTWENERVNRYNGERAMKAQCDVAPGILPDELYQELKDEIEAIPLPDGYTRRWDGTVASAEEAQSALFLYLPLALGLMIIIIIGLFNNLKQPAIIFLIVPFAFVGVVIGFLITGMTLTFIGIIGALGLIGMMIKNSVVLLDEINIGIREGKTAIESTIDASVSRMRPVMMASLTTILGMFPLVWDVMFNSLAITIMFGLLIGSLITLLVVPVMYAVFYNLNTKTLRQKSNN